MRCVPQVWLVALLLLGCVVQTWDGAQAQTPLPTAPCPPFPCASTRPPGNNTTGGGDAPWEHWPRIAGIPVPTWTLQVFGGILCLWAFLYVLDKFSWGTWAKARFKRHLNKDTQESTRTWTTPPSQSRKPSKPR